MERSFSLKAGEKNRSEMLRVGVFCFLFFFIIVSIDFSSTGQPRLCFAGYDGGWRHTNTPMHTHPANHFFFLLTVKAGSNSWRRTCLRPLASCDSKLNSLQSPVCCSSLLFHCCCCSVVSLLGSFSHLPALVKESWLVVVPLPCPDQKSLKRGQLLKTSDISM